LEARADRTCFGSCLYLSPVSVGWSNCASREKPVLLGEVSLGVLGVTVDELSSCFNRAFWFSGCDATWAVDEVVELTPPSSDVALLNSDDDLIAVVADNAVDKRDALAAVPVESLDPWTEFVVRTDWLLLTERTDWAMEADCSDFPDSRSVFFDGG